MSDKADSSEDPKPGELKSLVDSFDLTPDWAKGKPGVSQTEPLRRSGGKSKGRGRGPGRGNRDDRPRAPSSSRPSMHGVRVKPRRGQGDGSGGDQRGRSGGHSRHRERPPRVPVHVDFIPEKKRLSKVVKVIRQSHRAYPLSVVAEKFMENPRFISMKYTVKENAPDAEDFYLYVCTANGMVFSDRQACEAYVLDHGIEANYEREDREVDLPKGNFVCVGRHSRSGKLIGPPNWHGYQARMEAIRAEVDEQASLEQFSRGVEMVHEEEAVEAWKKEVSVQSFYRKKPEEVPEAPKKDDSSEKEAPSDTPEVSDSSNDSDSTESPEPADTEKASEASETVDTPEAPDTADAGGGSEASTPSDPAEEAPGPPAPADTEAAFEWTREQAEADFRETYLPKLIKKTKRAIMPGYLIEKMTDPSLGNMTRYHLNREHDRPNSIIFALRPAFKHMRLHVFRHHGELMVSGVTQHPLPADMKVVDEIRHLLDYVTQNPGCTTQEALKGVAKDAENIPAELISHLKWMVEKGHVVELHDDTLHLPHASGKK